MINGTTKVLHDIKILTHDWSFGFIYSKTHEVYTWRIYGAVGLGLFKLEGSWVRYNISMILLEATYPVAPWRPHVILIVSHCADYELKVKWEHHRRPDTDELLVLELAVRVYSSRTRNSVWCFILDGRITGDSHEPVVYTARARPLPP